MAIRGSAIISQFESGDEVSWKTTVVGPDDNRSTMERTGYFGGMRQDGSLILFLLSRTGTFEKTKIPRPYANMVIAELERYDSNASAMPAAST